MSVLITAPSPGALVVPQGQPADGLADACTQQACAQQRPPEGLVYGFTHDSVALATLMLVAVTAALWVATYRLWRTTLGMADDAKTSAVEQADKMERSIAETARLASAASAQVEIARDTSYRDLRAYISVERVVVTDVMVGSIAGNIVFKNAGETPAEIAVYFATDINNVPLGEPQRQIPGRAWQHRPFINRRGEESVYWWYPVHDPKDQAAALAKSRKEIAEVIKDPLGYSFYLYGRIEFLDYMRRERVLHFFYRSAAEVRIGEPFKMVPMPSGNHYEDRSKAANHG